MTKKEDWGWHPRAAKAFEPHVRKAPDNERIEWGNFDAACPWKEGSEGAKLWHKCREDRPKTFAEFDAIAKALELKSYHNPRDHLAWLATWQFYKRGNEQPGFPFVRFTGELQRVLDSLNANAAAEVAGELEAQ
jgi:hypothetical protein